MATLKQIINKCQDKLALPRSTAVVSSTDPNVRILLAMADEEGKELSRRHTWQALTLEKTFTSLAQTIQTSALPADMGNPKRFVQASMFNRTRKRRVTGPLSPEEWQANQALSVSLLTDAFRVRGNELLITPTPTAGDTYAFEYISSYWVDTDGDGAGEAEAWDADDDTTLLSDDLMTLGIVWRFRKARGLDYAEEFNIYEREVAQARMRDGSARVINYAYDDTIYDHSRPPLVVEGSWNL